MQSLYMFLAKRMFLNRTLVNEKLSADIPSTYKKLVFLKRKTGQISVCQLCCQILLEGKDSSGYVLGYSTKQENFEYRNYTREAEKLHSDGYLVVDRNNFHGCHFSLKHFPPVYNANKSEIETLPNGGESITTKRSWMSFRNNWGGGQNEELQKAHRKRLAE